jgi:hypothetical protein
LQLPHVECFTDDLLDTLLLQAAAQVVESSKKKPKNEAEMWRLALTCALIYVVAPAYAFMTGGMALPGLRSRSSGIPLSLRMADFATPAPAQDGKFANLMADCRDWGLCRFITINAGGAVLETASPMNVGLSFFNVPGKGQYATLARLKIFVFV